MNRFNKGDFRRLTLVMPLVNSKNEKRVLTCIRNPSMTCQELKRIGIERRVVDYRAIAEIRDMNKVARKVRKCQYVWDFDMQKTESTVKQYQLEIEFEKFEKCFYYKKNLLLC